jgi:hypothetical protein
MSTSFIIATCALAAFELAFITFFALRFSRFTRTLVVPSVGDWMRHTPATSWRRAQQSIAEMRAHFLERDRRRALDYTSWIGRRLCWFLHLEDGVQRDVMVAVFVVLAGTTGGVVGWSKVDPMGAVYGVLGMAAFTIVSSVIIEWVVLPLVAHRLWAQVRAQHREEMRARRAWPHATR